MSDSHRHFRRCRQAAATIRFLRTGPGRSACRRSRGCGPSISCRPTSGPSPSTSPRSRRSPPIPRRRRFENTIVALENSGRAAAPRRRRVRPSGRHRQQRRAAGDRARHLAARRRALEQGPDERGAVRAHRRAASRRATRSSLTPEQARVLERYHTSHRRSGAALDAAEQAAARRDHRAAGRRSAPRSARTCWPTSSPMRWCWKPRTNSPACRISCARPRARPPRSAACPASTPSRCSAPASSRSCSSRRGAICARRRSAPGRAAATTTTSPTTRRSSPRPWRCAPSAPSCSATRPSRTTGSTTPWRRRRRAVRGLLEKVWAPARVRALADRDAMQEIIREEGGNFALAPWDWRYYAEKLRKRRCDIDEASVKPYMQLDNIIEAAFHTAQPAVRPDLHARRRAGLASRTCAPGRCAAPTAAMSGCSSAIISRGPSQAERRLDGHAARPGEARRRRAADRLQRDELQQGRADAAVVRRRPHAVPRIRPCAARPAVERHLSADRPAPTC